MKITNIQQQVKRQNRYSVFVDGTYSFSLGDAALLDAKISVGQEIDDAALAALKKLSADDKLYNSVLNYLAIRPRSTWEIQSYLKRKDADEDQAKQIIQKLIDLKLIDDYDFARRWIENRRLLKPTSRRKLQLELRAKNVPSDVIDAALSEADDLSDQSTLNELVARKRKQTKYQDDQKLMQYLARQGFQYDDIKNALRAEE